MVTTRQPRNQDAASGHLIRCGRIAANFVVPHASSKNDFGPERKQTIFRLKLPGVGESIPGIEQKRNAESTLPLPTEEIELWRAHLTNVWCATHRYIAPLYRRSRVFFVHSYPCRVQDGLAGNDQDCSGGAAEDGGDARRAARDLRDARPQAILIELGFAGRGLKRAVRSAKSVVSDAI